MLKKSKVKVMLFMGRLSFGLLFMNRIVLCETKKKPTDATESTYSICKFENSKSHNNNKYRPTEHSKTIQTTILAYDLNLVQYSCVQNMPNNVLTTHF